MPELPEVETIVRDLRALVTNRVLRYPRLYKPDVLRGVSPRRFLAAVRNARVAEVGRRAKHVVLRLEGGPRLVIQLRMTGSLIVYRRPLRADERRYAVFLASLGGGDRLAFRDVRRLGTMSLLNESQWLAYTSRVGPEPLDDAFDLEAFVAALRATRQAVKKAIMDQRRIAGVGNIYANEALWRARIDPSRPGRALRREEGRALYGAIREVLTEAIEGGGTTFRDYRSGTGQPGSFQGALAVYGRHGEPCLRCGTRLHTTHAVDARATTICWRCQT